MPLEETLDRIARKAAGNTFAPSLSIAATLNGQVVYCKTFGDASTKTIYNIASVTKQFTAACLLLLAREKKLSLDDSVARWFPNLTRARDVTLRHLLSHTSGYPDYYPLSFPDEEKRHDTPPEEIVLRYAGRELQFEPGSSWSYSNTGYHIAGLIVERVAGEAFGSFLQRRVLQAAGMGASFFNDPPTQTEMHARGYTRHCLGPQRPAEEEHAGWTYSSGGIASTAEDLTRWHTVLMARSLLSEDEIAEMTRPYVLNDGSASATALGWFPEDRGGHMIVQHSGGLAGFVSQTIVSLEDRASVVVLCNGDHVPVGAIASELFEAIVPGATPPSTTFEANAEHAEQTVRNWIARFRSGDIDRSLLDPEFSAYLTPERLRDAADGFSTAGETLKVDALVAGERGGMPWYRVRVTFDRRLADVVLRETQTGRLAEINAYPLP